MATKRKTTRRKPARKRRSLGGLGSSAEIHKFRAEEAARMAGGGLTNMRRALREGDCKLALWWLLQSSQSLESTAENRRGAARRSEGHRASANRKRKTMTTMRNASNLFFRACVVK